MGISAPLRLIDIKLTVPAYRTVDDVTQGPVGSEEARNNTFTQGGCKARRDTDGKQGI